MSCSATSPFVVTSALVSEFNLAGLFYGISVRDGTPTPELLVLHYSRTLAAVDRTVFYDQSDSFSFKHVLDHVIIM